MSRRQHLQPLQQYSVACFISRLVIINWRYSVMCDLTNKPYQSVKDDIRPT